MSKQASPTLIGAFVIGAIALAMAAIIILGGGKLFTRQLPVVMYFDGSLAGLSPGAPITFRGVRVGQVTEVFLRYDLAQQNIRIPVFGVIEPRQIQAVGEPPPDQPDGSGLKQLIDRGMRAQLGVSSLVTGQMAVNLDFFRSAAPSPAAATDNPYPDRVEIPTEPSTIEAVQETLQTVIQKISRLPLDQILADVRTAINSVTTVINNPQLAEVVPNLNETLVNVRHLSETLDQKLGPVIERAEASAPLVDQTLVRARASLGDMQRALAAIERAANRAEQTMGSANALVQPNSPVLFDMSNALREVTAAARSMRNLSDTIARDPNSLLFGRTRPGGAR
ncbi:MAG: MlaD family protein [Rhodospirillales bacterium]